MKMYNFYKLPFLKANRKITAGPIKTIIAKDTSCPITCQFIIILKPLFSNKIYLTIIFSIIISHLSVYS